MENPKKRVRFSFDDDVLLLREVLSLNPVQNGSSAWEEIKANLYSVTRKFFGVKTLRQHLNMLLENFKKEEDKNQKSSGIEEPYNERNHLLQEISDIFEEAKRARVEKSTQKNIAKINLEIGQEVRDKVALKFYEDSACEVDHNYANSLSEPSTSSTFIQDQPIEVEETSHKKAAEVTSMPKLSAKRNPQNVLGRIKTKVKSTTHFRKSGLDYLKEKNVQDIELEKKKLEIEERKVAVAERQITLAENKFNFESEQYKQMFENQNKVINGLLSLLQDKIKQ